MSMRETFFGQIRIQPDELSGFLIFKPDARKNEAENKKSRAVTPSAWVLRTDFTLGVFSKK